MSKSVFEYINAIAHQLEPLYDEQKERYAIAQWLLEAVTQKQMVALIVQDTVALTDDQQKQLDEWIHDHVTEKKPLQYILGTVPFCSLSLNVKPPTLIPRPETEQWCAALIDQLAPIGTTPFTVLDLCTGSGCIALAIAHTYQHARVIGTDISPTALMLASENAIKNNIKNIELFESDLFAQLPLNFKADIIVANPPYIAEKLWENLDPMVKEWEDKQALAAQNNGFEIIQKIITQAPHFLKQNDIIKKHAIPQLIIELDPHQAQQACNLMKQSGFTHTAIKKDLFGKERIVTGSL